MDWRAAGNGHSVSNETELVLVILAGYEGNKRTARWNPVSADFGNRKPCAIPLRFSAAGVATLELHGAVVLELDWLRKAKVFTIDDEINILGETTDEVEDFS